jgi:uncharacterized DUF497 family protein
MALIFEWDAEKATANLRKHAVTFEEATTVLADELSMTIPDPQHSTAEHRFVTVGLSHRGNLLVVVSTDRGERIRLISARPATARERKLYEEGQ